MPRNNKKILKIILQSPQKTGVYFFLNKKGKALYVGKAVNIKNRLQSHFAQKGTRYSSTKVPGTINPARVKLLKETRTLKWELCDSEPEALIREAELIKKLKPRYNVLLRDDKNYFYVGITQEAFPKVFLTHQTKGIGYRVKGLENARILKLAPLHPKPYTLNPLFIGPFTDGNSLKRTLKLLRRIFPYCTCHTSHKRECLAAMLGRCIGVCCLGQPHLTTNNQQLTTLKKLYRKNIKYLEEILRGKKQRLTGTLKKDMQEAAKEHRFEDAARVRDQIQALESIFSHRVVVANGEFLQERKKALRLLQKLLKSPQLPYRIEMYDMSNIHGRFAVGSMVVFINGIPDKNQYRRFKIKTVKGIDDTAMMREVIARRLCHKEWLWPDALIVDGGKGQISAAIAVIRSQPSAIGDQLIPVLGLAKGKGELHLARTYTDENTKSIIVPQSRLPRSLRHLFNHLQDEAHRFAITYYRKLHSKALTR